MKKFFEKPSRKSLSIFFGIASIILLLSFASPSFAFTIDNPLINSPDLATLIGNITNFVFLISITLAPLMIILAGFYYVTANGDPEKVKKANNILLYTAIGIAVILLSRAFVWTIRGAL